MRRLIVLAVLLVGVTALGQSEYNDWGMNPNTTLARSEASFFGAQLDQPVMLSQEEFNEWGVDSTFRLA